MERLYFHQADSDQTMVEWLGVARATIYRYRIELETQALGEMYNWQTRRRAAALVPSHDESFGDFLGGDTK